MKKGVILASAVAAAMVLAGCSHPQPMPQNQSMQTAPGGKMGNGCKGHHCKGHKCKGQNCKGQNCKGNSCNTYNDN